MGRNNRTTNAAMFETINAAFSRRQRHLADAEFREQQIIAAMRIYAMDRRRAVAWVADRWRDVPHLHQAPPPYHP